MSEASIVHTQFIQLKMVKIRMKIRTRFNALLCLAHHDMVENMHLI